MSIRWLRLAPLLLLPLAACGSADAAVVRLSTTDRSLEEVPRTVFTVGNVQGREYESFTHVAHTAFDSAENLYVLDRGVGKVLVFDRAGRFVRAIGRRGQGPAELQTALQVAVTREGLVVVSDISKRGYVVFDADGRFVRVLPFAERGMLAGMDVRPHPRGGFVSVYQSPPGATSGGVIRMTWHSLTEGVAPRTLLQLRVQPEVFSAPVSTPDERVFLPRLQWGLLPDGRIALSGTPEYRLEVAAADGAPERIIERPLHPRRVTRHDRMDERLRRHAALQEHGAGLASVERQRLIGEIENLRFARVMPVIDELALDPFGNAWVRRRDGDAQVVDLVTTAGEYAGTMPGARLPVAFSYGGLAAYVDEDSLGVSRITVRELPSGWRQFASRGARLPSQ